METNALSYVVTYGKTYNAEMETYIPREVRSQNWFWRHYEHRQEWKAWRYNGQVVILKDDDRLDFTRVMVLSESEFEDWRRKLLYSRDIENGNAPFGHQRHPISRK